MKKTKLFTSLAFSSLMIVSLFSCNNSNNTSSGFIPDTGGTTGGSSSTPIGPKYQLEVTWKFRHTDEYTGTHKTELEYYYFGEEFLPDEHIIVTAYNTTNPNETYVLKYNLQYKINPDYTYGEYTPCLQLPANTNLGLTIEVTDQNPLLSQIPQHLLIIKRDADYIKYEDSICVNNN